MSTPTTETRSFVVPNIGCDGCVRTIVSTLSAQAGVIAVQGDTAAKRVTVQWQAPMTWEGIVDQLTAIAYSPAEPLMP